MGRDHIATLPTILSRVETTRDGLGRIVRVESSNRANRVALRYGVAIKDLIGGEDQNGHANLPRRQRCQISEVVRGQVEQIVRRSAAADGLLQPIHVAGNCIGFSVRLQLYLYLHVRQEWHAPVFIYLSEMFRKVSRDECGHLSRNKNATASPS